MTKKSKKRSLTSSSSSSSSNTKWSDLPWNKISTHEEIQEESFYNSKNHYDNPKASSQDLYDPSSTNKSIDFVQGANDPGVFLGLEVIDGSQYDIEKIKVKNQVSGVVEGYVSRLVVKNGNSSDGKEKKDQDDSSKKETSSNKTSDDNNKKKNDLKQKQDTPSTATVTDTTTSTTTTPPPPAETKMTRKERNKLKLKQMKEKRKLERQKRKLEKQQEQGESSTPQQPNKKKHKKTQPTVQQTTIQVSQQDMESIRVPWSIATGGVYLHPKLCTSLFRLGFTSPTPIQSSTLAASILGQRDIVGAAPTGSGKTLSYLLPILHTLLTEEEEEESSNETIKRYPLTALILCPTRELAMQVSQEFAKLIGNANEKSLIKCGTIVGGLAEQKQKRVLNQKRPPVLVATPGRLWDLMSSGEHDHLTNLQYLRYLVIDEADRMISQGSFPQLERIFEKIQEANPSLEYLAAQEEEEYESDSDDEDRLLGLPGVRGEARVQMLDDDILQMIEQQRSGGKVGNSIMDQNMKSDFDITKPVEMDDDEYEAMMNQSVEHSEDESDDEQAEEEEETVKRQTFVFSATLTLPTSSHQQISTQLKPKKGKKGNKKQNSVEGAIAEILEKVGSQGQTKVVDLSTSAPPPQIEQAKKKSSKHTEVEGAIKPTVKLPPGLSLYEIKCTQKHKDSHLYSFLVSTKQGAAGPCLVFCNSIGAVKRVGETLKVLGLPVRMLHAQMQQKARLSALESLRKSGSRAIVIATDVAARGLDIPNVASIVHYDVARRVDTFVHRAGRTARGVGEKAIGWSVSLVAAPEERSHQTICRAVKGDTSSFDPAPMDSRLLTKAQERVNLATKIVSCEDSESRTNKSNQWFIKAAEDAGLELDEELLDDGQLGGSQKDRQQYLEAKRAREELKTLLSQPLRKQAYGKFIQVNPSVFGAEKV